MVKSDFDNLMKVISSRILLTGVSGVSQEMDLELPRGMIAKIKMVVMRFTAISEDVDTLVTADWDQIMALVRDPDDAITREIPNNTVQHDVIADFAMDVLVDATATQGNTFITESQLVLDFAKNEMDVITARNLRHNCAAQGSEGGSVTEGESICEVYYTLEKVTDADILNLLDIL